MKPQLLFKNKNYKLLWASQILSQITINLMNFVLLTKLFLVTESTVATSLLWVAYALPGIFFGPIGAVIVDMYERRKILMLTNLMQAVVVLGYSFFHTDKVFLLYSVVLGYSFFNQFYVPAEAAALPSLVKPKDLPKANSMFFLTQQVSLVVGFAIAGLFLRLFGFVNTLYICSFMLFVAFLSVSFLPELKVGRGKNFDFEQSFKEFFDKVIEGYRFIKNNRNVLIPFLLLLGFQIGLAVLMVNIPIIARDILAIEGDFAGIAIIVPGGIGATAGAYLVSKLIERKWRKRRLIDISLRALLVTLVSIAFIIPNFPFVYRLLFNFLAMIIAGASFIGIFVPSQTFLQEATPGGLRGRVFGNFWFLATIATIFPVIFSGVISEILGVKFLLFALACLCGFTIFASKKVGFYNTNKKIYY